MASGGRAWADEKPHSEASAWHGVVAHAGEIRRRSKDAKIRNHAVTLETIAGYMLEQLKRGEHKNPALVVFNPPFKLPRAGRGGAMTVRVTHVISDEAVEMKYMYGDAGYVHKFETPARIYAAEGGSPGQGGRCLLLVGKDGQPLWATDSEVRAGTVE